MHTFGQLWSDSAKEIYVTLTCYGIRRFCSFLLLRDQPWFLFAAEMQWRSSLFQVRWHLRIPCSSEVQQEADIREDILFKSLSASLEKNQELKHRLLSLITVDKNAVSTPHQKEGDRKDKWEETKSKKSHSIVMSLITTANSVIQ